MQEYPELEGPEFAGPQCAKSKEPWIECQGGAESPAFEELGGNPRFEGVDREVFCRSYG